MDSTPQNGHTSPHWEGNCSYIKDSDASGSCRIPVRALSITWGNDPRYWQWVTLGEDGTQFGEGTMLQQVNWIEVTGKMDLSLFEKRPNVWKELPGGEFSISNSITGGNVEFGIFEVETDRWKGSMVLAGIKVNPKTP
ncbi:hypothetical protein RJ639_028495 [Escallonia herrerae]|uniref:Uncharacterized protein n=1 Tax=Escallonia herrerae TaxID=1293975 RepID=A0AA89BGB0_9ASTE|nr:hypothetical protein RJ639_028495 [Escallonia herrerae]